MFKNKAKSAESALFGDLKIDLTPYFSQRLKSGSAKWTLNFPKFSAVSALFDELVTISRPTARFVGEFYYNGYVVDSKWIQPYYNFDRNSINNIIIKRYLS